MKRSRIIQIQILILKFSFIFFLFSCGKAPPEDTKKVEFLDFMQEYFEQLTQAKDNPELRKVLNEKFDNLDFKLTFNKNDKIVINFVHSPPRSMDLIYHDKNNEYVFTHDTWITDDNDGEMMFSLNNEVWYYITAEKNGKEYENLINQVDIKINSNKDHILNVDFKFNLEINKNLIKANKQNKIVVHLKSGDIIYNKKYKNKLDVSLKRNILFFPKDTRVKFNINSDSNLINFKKGKENQIILTALKYMQFYRPEKFVASLSFDGIDWGLYITKFKIAFNVYAEAISSNSVEYFYDLTAIYNG